MDHELTARWHELDKVQVGLKDVVVLRPDLSPIQRQIGDLSDLTTEAKENLVAAINEVVRKGGTGSMDLRVTDGYIQYSTDGGRTWQNLIAVAELKGAKGDKGDPGAKGEPGEKGDTGATGADGITPHIGDNGNWYLGTTDTGKPSRGETGAKGDTGAPGKDGAGMDITGATVGQIAKITAVDASGVPTAWEPVDMPSGGGGETWEEINVITLADAVNTVTINTDSGGNAITLKKVRIMVEGSATQIQDLFFNNFRYIRAQVVGAGASVGALSAEPFCGKMYCFAVPNTAANYAANSQLTNIFSAEITITDIKLIVNNSGTFSAGTKFTIQGVRA